MESEAPNATNRAGSQPRRDGVRGVAQIEHQVIADGDGAQRVMAAASGMLRGGERAGEEVRRMAAVLAHISVVPVELADEAGVEKRRALEARAPAADQRAGAVRVHGAGQVEQGRERVRMARRDGAGE